MKHRGRLNADLARSVDRLRRSQITCCVRVPLSLDIWNATRGTKLDESFKTPSPLDCFPSIMVQFDFCGMPTYHKVQYLQDVSISRARRLYTDMEQCKLAISRVLPAYVHESGHIRGEMGADLTGSDFCCI